MMIIDTVVVGAGHAGLAVSRLLTDAGRDHVVLDRGRVAERWRTERWDSLHLLTPNWMTRLPGWCYRGPDPDGYMSAAELVRLPGALRRLVRAPVIPSTTVVEISATRGPGLRPLPGRHRQRHLAGPSRRRRHRARTVVPYLPERPGRRLESCRGAHRELVPQPRAASPRRRARRGRLRLRRADRRRAEPRRAGGGPRGRPAHPDAAPLPRHGHLLVAGGHRSAGPHDRPDARRRGGAARNLAAAGRPRRAVQLRGPTSTWQVLQDRGVRLLGRLEGVAGTEASFRTISPSSVAAADRKMHPSSLRVDDYIDKAGLTARSCPPVRPGPVDVPESVRALWTWPPRGSAPCSSRPATARTTPGCALPVLAPDGSHPAAPRRHAGTGSVRRRAALPAPPRLRLHRRRPARRPLVVDHLLGRGDRDRRFAAPRCVGGMNGYDVVVVGGRVAGASTALLLARAGARVALLDRVATAATPSRPTG